MYDWGCAGAAGELVDELVDEAIGGLDQGAAIVELVRLRDRVNLELTERVGGCDEARLWDVDAATSMAGWLVDHAVLTYREAVGLTVRAKRLRGLPVTKAAWRDGALAGGQVTVIVERLGAQRTVRWSEHEAALVPALGGLSIDDTTRAVDAWKAHADADGPTPPAQPQVLFPSRVGERWRTDGDFDALDGDLIGTAIRLATRPPDGDGPPRPPAQTRADALVDVCRFFIDLWNAVKAGVDW